MSSTEKGTQKIILEYLKAKGILHWRQNSGSKGKYKFTSINGISDIIAIKEGIFYGIEVKDIKGKQNENQIEFQRLLEKAGGIYILARSLDDVIEKI